MDEYNFLAVKSEYEHDPDFKDYVDKYCEKHNKSVDEALQDAIIIAFLNYKNNL